MGGVRNRFVRIGIYQERLGIGYYGMEWIRKSRKPVCTGWNGFERVCAGWNGTERVCAGWNGFERVWNRFVLV